MTAHTPRAFSYARYSSTAQSETSIERQTKFAEDWSEKTGIPLDNSLRLVDRGVSGYSGKNAKNGKLALFIEEVRAGRVRRGDILIIESLDRLTRMNLARARALVDELLNSGITIVVRVPQDTFTPEGQDDLVQQIKITLYLKRANEESETKSVRVKEAAERRRRAARDGEALFTSIAPLWLRAKNNRSGFEKIPDRVKMVRRMFTLAQSVGAVVIREALIEEGFADVPGLWWINDTLRGRRVLGEFQPGVMVDGERKESGEPIPDYFPRIVTDKVWHRVQSRIEQRNTSSAVRHKRVANLFAGLVFDKNGETFRYTDAVRKSGANSAYLRTKRGTYEVVGIPYDLFEATFAVFCSDLPLNEVEPPKHDIASQRATIAVIEERVREVNGRMREGEFALLVDYLQGLNDELDQEKEKLAHMLSEAASEPRRALSSVKRLLGSKSVEDRARVHRAIRDFVERITITRLTRDIKTYTAHIVVDLVGGNRRMVVLHGIDVLFCPESLPIDAEGSEPVLGDWRAVRLEGADLERYTSPSWSSWIDYRDQGYTLQDVAEEVGMSPTACSKYIRRAREARAAKLDR